MRARLESYTSLRCQRCGGRHAKTQIEEPFSAGRFKACGLRRLTNRRVGFSKAAHARPESRSFGVSEGVSVPTHDRERFAFLWLDPADELVYDVTAWARCHFNSAEDTYKFTMGDLLQPKESERLWAARFAHGSDGCGARTNPPAANNPHTAKHAPAAAADTRYNKKKPVNSNMKGGTRTPLRRKGPAK